MKPLEGKFVVCADPEANMGEVHRLLERWGSRTQTVKTIEQLRKTLEVEPVDLIVAFVCRTSPTALEFFPPRERMEQLPPVVIVVCTLDVDLYLEAMRRGAFDCISLPLEEKEFARIVSRALLEGPVRMAPAVA